MYSAGSAPHETMARSTPADARHRQLAASPLSFAKRKEAQRMQQHPPGTNESSGRMSGIAGDAPGHGIAKSRSVYFEDAFQAGREVSPAKDLIVSEAIVAAEVRTNVIVSFLALGSHPLTDDTIRWETSTASSGTWRASCLSDTRSPCPPSWSH